MPARTSLALLALLGLAGCGGTAERRAPAPTPRPPTAAAAFDLPGQKLVSVWRNFEFTGIPDEMTVYQDGNVRYRNLLHTQTTIKVLTDKLPPARLARLRRLVGAVDLERADASGVKPVRSGYRYVVRP